jgi:Flp pilus assembly protein TadG
VAITVGDSLGAVSIERGHMVTRARRQRGEKGAALLEFILVLPIFVYVIYSMIGFGLAVSLKEDITHASAEGARAAIGAQVTTGQTALQAQTAAVDTRVQNVLGWLGSNYSNVVVQVDPTGFNTSCPTAADPSGTCLEVIVTYDYGDHPIIPAAPGLGYFNPTTLSSTAVVQVS